MKNFIQIKFFRRRDAKVDVWEIRGIIYLNRVEESWKI